MKHLARSIITLLIGLAVFFNIERMDFGQQNVIDIQTFVYVLGILAVLAVIMIPAMWNTPLPVSLALWLGLYLLCRLSFFSSRPLLGGVHTYLSITEVALLSILVGLAHNVGRGLHDITLSDVNRRVRNMDEAIEDIRMELVRSRRHQRPLTVMVIEAKPESIRAVLHRTVQEVQRAMMTRYVVTSVPCRKCNER
ncbi:MAG: putative diguanylate cyclase [Anaerolineales bacterium]|nr:putative diguanylate cyclase [Anaerolineales bacterium]